MEIVVTNMDAESVWMYGCVSIPVHRLDGAALATAGIICALPGGTPSWDPEIEPCEQITLSRHLSAEPDGWPEPVTGNDYVIDVALYEKNQPSFVVASEPFRIELR